MRLGLRLCAYDQPQVSYNVVIGPSLLDFNLAGSTLHILTKPWIDYVSQDSQAPT